MTDHHNTGVCWKSIYGTLLICSQASVLQVGRLQSSLEMSMSPWRSRWLVSRQILLQLLTISGESSVTPPQLLCCSAPLCFHSPPTLPLCNNPLKLSTVSMPLLLLSSTRITVKYQEINVCEMTSFATLFFFFLQATLQTLLLPQQMEVSGRFWALGNLSMHILAESASLPSNMTP